VMAGENAALVECAARKFSASNPCARADSGARQASPARTVTWILIRYLRRTGEVWERAKPRRRRNRIGKSRRTRSPRPPGGGPDDVEQAQPPPARLPATALVMEPSC